MTGDRDSDLDDFEQQLLARARQSLDESLEAVDPRAAQRLTQIRREAVAAAVSSPEYVTSPLWQSDVGRLSPWQSGTGLATAAAMMVLTVSLLWSGVARQEVSIALLDDEVVLMSEELDIELYQELDFYLWLVDEAEPG